MLRALQADDDVRVVVLTGAGDKAFVSGADISEFGSQRTTTAARAAFDAGQVDAGRAWVELEKPILAMIRGYCIGGGLLTALQADIRVCSEDSQFGVPAARLGLGYGFGGVDQLIQLVGPSWASEILFSRAGSPPQRRCTRDSSTVSCQPTRCATRSGSSPAQSATTPR